MNSLKKIPEGKKNPHPFMINLYKKRKLPFLLIVWSRKELKAQKLHSCDLFQELGLLYSLR